MNPVTALLDNMHSIEYGSESKGDDSAYTSDNFSLQDFIDKAAKANSLSCIHALCRRIQTYYGFNFFGIGMMIPTVDSRPLFFHLYDFKSDWVRHYRNHGLLFQDPFVRHSVYSMTPVIWQHSDTDSHMNKMEQKVMMAAREFGAQTILQIPCRGLHGDMGGIRFSVYNAVALAREEILPKLGDLHLLSAYIHEAIYRVAEAEFEPIRSIKLTQREQEVLRWAAQGKESWAIAEILNIAESTVLTHIKHIYQKLGVRTRQHAIAKALTMRLIYL